MRIYGSNPRDLLSKVAQNDATITSLDLAGNPSFQTNSDERMVVLSEALKSNTILTELNLNSCCITSVGAVAMAEALKVPPVRRQDAAASPKRH
eukprot:scaffold1_cov402-Prasinococcus_capsulatus_cf.AAC.6